MNVPPENKPTAQSRAISPDAPDGKGRDSRFREKMQTQIHWNYEHYQPLVLLFLALLAGTALDRQLIFSHSSLLFGFISGCFFWSILCLSMLIGWIILFRFFPRTPRMIPSSVLLLAVMALGGMSAHMHWNCFKENELGQYARDQFTLCCVRGIVSRPPVYIPPEENEEAYRMSPDEFQTRLQLSALQIRENDGLHQVSGWVNVRVKGKLQNIHAGDRVEIFGHLLKPQPVMNPGSFSIKNYLRSDRILCILKVAEPECVHVYERPRYWGFFRTVEFLRDNAKSQLDIHLHEHQRRLGGALLLGYRDDVYHSEMNAFLETGTIHMLAISGLHIGMLGFTLFQILRLCRLPEFYVGLLVVISIFLYVFITGARPPAIRAAILIAVTALAFSTRNRGYMFNTLSAAGIVVLMINPTSMLGIGPQLSFLAVAVLAGMTRYVPGTDLKKAENEIENEMLDTTWAETPEKIQDPFKKRMPLKVWLWRMVYSLFGFIWTRRLYKIAFHIRSLIFISLIMSAVTMPLIARNFHVISYAGIILNLLLWIPLIVVMVTGCSLILVALLCPPAASLLGDICSAAVWFMQKSVDVTMQIPYHCTWVSGPEIWWLVGFYWLMFLLGMVVSTRVGMTRILNLCILWCLVGIIGLQPAVLKWRHQLGLGILRVPENTLRCTFLSVGHGLCAILEFPNGKVLMFDAGQAGYPDFLVQTISCYLWQRGIFELDTIVISHPDTDHYNALPGIMNRFPVGTVFISGYSRSILDTQLEADSLNNTGPRPELVGRNNIPGHKPVPGTADSVKVSSSAAKRAKMMEDNATLWEKLHKRLADTGIPVETLRTGDRIRISPRCLVEVLYPPEVTGIKNNNANSITLMVTFQGKKILLTGDLAPPGLNRTIETKNLKCDLLQAPHHGGRTSNPPLLAEKTDPDWVVISESPLHPQVICKQVYESAGAQVLHTGNDGAVISIISDGKLNVSTYRDE